MLLNEHIDGLYVHADDGRLLRCNEITRRSAPRFYLGRTPSQIIWRFRFDVPDALIRELTALCLDEPLVDDLRQQPRHASGYAALLESTAAPWSGPAMYFPTLPPTDPLPVAISPRDAACLRGTLDDWIADVPDRQPFLVAMDADRAVAVCCSVRITPQAHEAGVETIASHRGRGFAHRVVTAWAHAVRRMGVTPLYSTSWENPASQRVAAKLGLKTYGSDFHID